jgi:hypothetical protein
MLCKNYFYILSNILCLIYLLIFLFCDEKIKILTNRASCFCICASKTWHFIVVSFIDTINLKTSLIEYVNDL